MIRHKLCTQPIFRCQGEIRREFSNIQENFNDFRLLSRKQLRYGKLVFQMFILLIGMSLFFTAGCSFRYLGYKENLTTELVSLEELPRYNKITVCQGPAILFLSSETLFCNVRCYDSNNDAKMLSLRHRGIDVFEYRLPEIRKNINGQFYHSVAEAPYTVLIDIDFDGIGDFIYLFRTTTVEGHRIYEKIKIGHHHLVMDDFAPASFRLSDFNS